MQNNKRPWSTLKKIRFILDILQLALASFILYDLITSTDKEDDESL